jgi:hypothetical protein
VARGALVLGHVLVGADDPEGLTVGQIFNVFTLSQGKVSTGVTF